MGTYRRTPGTPEPVRRNRPEQPKTTHVASTNGRARGRFPFGSLEPAIAVARVAEQVHSVAANCRHVDVRISNISGKGRERDIVHAIGGGGAAALNDAVSKHMTTAVVAAHEDESVDLTMEKMTVRRCRHLPVVVDEKLVGIVSIGDVVKHRLEQIEQEYQAMREYIATA